MKWLALALIAAIALIPGQVRAQEKLEIGTIPQIDDKSPTTWGMSGYDIFKISRSIGNNTPIMRTETFDARTVEILSRTQAPRLSAADVRTLTRDGREYVIVRRYLLAEVMPEDARAENTTKEALAAKWAAAVRKVLPQVAPLPSAFGI